MSNENEISTGLEDSTVQVEPEEQQKLESEVRQQDSHTGHHFKATRESYNSNG